MDRDLARQRAQALVARMTVEEAAGQLRYDAPAIERLGVPAYNWWNEALHGVARAGTATSFPQAIGLAAAFDPALLERLGGVAATEGRAKYNAAVRHGDRDVYKGLTFWSPNINIFRDPRWGRGHETYGEDPFLTAEMGKSFVRGLQGDGAFLKAAACAKHFAVHSGPETLRHAFNAEVSEHDLHDTYLPAFEKVVKEAEVESVMGAYNRVNGEPCCGSPRLIGDILRGEWGFAGHYVSDCGAIADFHENHRVTDSGPESAALALKSGNVCILRGGKEAFRSACAITDALRAGLRRAGVTENAVNLVRSTSRDSAAALMTAQGYVDLLIPRGGAGLIGACVRNATVPCIATGTGICHVYVEKTADQDMALNIIENAKTSRPSVCNAEEVLLVDRAIASEFLPKLYGRLVTDRERPVELRLDETAQAIIPGTPAGARDFDTEFLDYILAVACVDGVEEAIAHIAAHSTGHSEAIITSDPQAAQLFTACVDSAAVYVNASTRFTDGGEFGLGCEMGISTQKLHARGPMGLRELTTYHYIIQGNGQIR